MVPLCGRQPGRDLHEHAGQHRVLEVLHVAAGSRSKYGTRPSAKPRPSIEVRDVGVAGVRVLRAGAVEPAAVVAGRLLHHAEREHPDRHERDDPHRRPPGPLPSRAQRPDRPADQLAAGRGDLVLAGRAARRAARWCTLASLCAWHAAHPAVRDCGDGEGRRTEWCDGPRGRPPAAPLAGLSAERSACRPGATRSGRRRSPAVAVSVPVAAAGVPGGRRRVCRGRRASRAAVGRPVLPPVLVPPLLFWQFQSHASQLSLGRGFGTAGVLEGVVDGVLEGVVRRHVARRRAGALRAAAVDRRRPRAAASGSSRAPCPSAPRSCSRARSGPGTRHRGSSPRRPCRTSPGTCGSCASRCRPAGTC